MIKKRRAHKKPLPDYDAQKEIALQLDQIEITDKEKKQLLKYLEHDDPVVRGTAVFALARFDPQNAYPAIRFAINDPHPTTRAWAADARKHLGHDFLRQQYKSAMPQAFIKGSKFPDLVREHLEKQHPRYRKLLKELTVQTDEPMYSWSDTVNALHILQAWKMKSHPTLKEAAVYADGYYTRLKEAHRVFRFYKTVVDNTRALKNPDYNALAKEYGIDRSTLYDWVRGNTLPHAISPAKLLPMGRRIDVHTLRQSKPASFSYLLGMHVTAPLVKFSRDKRSLEFRKRTTSKKYAEHAAHTISKLIRRKVNPTLLRTGRYLISFKETALLRYLNRITNFGRRVPYTQASSQAERRGFLQAVFDHGGSFHKKYKTVIFRDTRNRENLLRQVSNLLDSFSIKSTLTTDINGPLLRINKQHLKRFRSEIGFRKIVEQEKLETAI